MFNVNRGDQERAVGNSSKNTSNHTIVRYRRIREAYLAVAISNSRRNHLTYKAKLTQNRQYKLHLNLLPRNLYNNHLTKLKGISQSRYSRAIRVRTRTAGLTHNYRYLHHFRATGRAYAPFPNIDNMCIMRLTQDVLSRNLVSTFNLINYTNLRILTCANRPRVQRSN